MCSLFVEARGSSQDPGSPEPGKMGTCEAASTTAVGKDMWIMRDNAIALLVFKVCSSRSIFAENLQEPIERAVFGQVSMNKISAESRNHHTNFKILLCVHLLLP